MHLQADGPSLGIEINKSHVRQQAKKTVNGHNLVWCHKDGCFAKLSTKT